MNVRLNDFYDNNKFSKPVLNLSATGKKIKTLMKQKNISPLELQVLMGFPYVQTIYNWTRGVNMPTVDNLVVLSKIFDVSMNDIIVTDTVDVDLAMGY